MNPPASGPLQVPPGTPFHVPVHMTHGWMSWDSKFSATGLEQGIAVRLALAGCWKGADVGLQLWE